LSGPVHGTGGLWFGGDGTVELTANNDFAGPVRSACKLLLLNAPSGGRPFTGSLDVGGYYRDLGFDFGELTTRGTNLTAEVRWLRAYQIIGAAATLQTNAFLNLNNFFEDFGPVTFNGGRVETGTGQMGIYQPVTVNPTSFPATINGILGLPPSPPLHPFHIGRGGTDSDLVINAVVVGAGGMDKDGTGTLWLTAPNTFSGAVFIDAGIVSVSHDAALGSTAIGSGTIVRSNATLRLAPGVTLHEQLSISGLGLDGTAGALNASGQCTVASPFPAISYFSLGSAATIRIEGVGSTLVLDGIIGGTGPLIKTGPGRLVLTGNNANTYTGDTLATEGTFELNKPMFVSAAPGNLVLGPPPSGGAPAIGRFDHTGEMGGDTATVNGNSLLDLNGNALTLARLNLNDGGSVQTGIGTLSFFGGGAVNVGSLGRFGSHASSSITGNIDLPANDRPSSFNLG